MSSRNDFEIGKCKLQLGFDFRELLLSVGRFLVIAVTTYLGLLAVTFFIGRVIPIDPVLAVLGNRAPAAVVERTRREMGLDLPLIEQFYIYIKGVLAGDFGRSVLTTNPVMDDIRRVFPATIELATMGTLIDPMMTHETSATGTLLMIVMVGIYLAAGGLHHTLSALYDSYALWAIDSLSPIFSRDAGAILLTLLTRILGMALTLVAPLIVSLLLSDVVLAFLARASPHLNIFALSLVVKTLVFSLVSVLYAAFLIHYMTSDLAFLDQGVNDLKALVGGAR